MDHFKTRLTNYLALGSFQYLWIQLLRSYELVEDHIDLVFHVCDSVLQAVHLLGWLTLAVFLSGKPSLVV
jgi:hypothetical protein